MSYYGDGTSKQMILDELRYVKSTQYVGKPLQFVHDIIEVTQYFIWEASDYYRTEGVCPEEIDD